MRKHKWTKRKVLIFLVITILAIIAGIGGYAVYGAHMIDRLAGLTFEEMLAYTTKDNKEAVITVGILRDGEVSYDVFGENGVKLPREEHDYEIGSITKTFTASLLCRAISEGKVGLDDPIDDYLDLPKKDHYPTIRSLVTHTSGYKSYYFETPMISNFFSGVNDFNGITREMLIKRLGKIDLGDRDYPFKYSNFGTATLGAVLEQVYDDNFTALMNSYVVQDLGLTRTTVSRMSGDLGNYWAWSESDAYMPAGALISNIHDMMIYVQMQMAEEPSYLSMAHDALAKANGSSSMNEKMGIRIDSVGIGWMIDDQHKIVWHNGATGNFNSYIGFDKDNGIGVVVLSNLPPRYRIPATVMGIALLADLQK